ncbi:MAG: hypothetical protein MUE44_15360 [Oscillatoriaceae cyanobacterium Prado104]|nr:hypothetical protein [Oscillatoriaceae cyanobacterium Prado104]
MKTAIVSISIFGMLSSIALGFLTIVGNLKADSLISCTPTEQPADEKSNGSPRRT